MLKGIYGWDQVTNSSRNTVTISPAKQQLLKDNIMKFILEIRSLHLQFRVVKYQANPIHNLYNAYKQAKFILLLLQTQLQLKESQEQKQGYKAFKSFQPSVGNNHRSRSSYNQSKRQAQLAPPNLLYRELRKIECNNIHPNRDKDATSV